MYKQLIIYNINYLKLMTSVTEYLEKLQKLTQTNCEILQAINDSFFSKSNHLTASVDNNNYVIPSFISLENKINALTENFNNLVYAPKTGEATFNFDGNSQTIELKGFNCTPRSITLDAPDRFNVEKNQIFKDFLSPSPYINFNIQSIPNDINKVVIKKIVVSSDILKKEFESYLVGENGKKVSIQINYADLFKKLSLYKKDVDYIEYDTIKQLPIRKTIGTGLYTISSIDSHNITDDLREEYVITIKEDLKYKLFDDVIDKYLQVGDELVTYDDSAKMRIVEVRSNSKQLKLEVLNGDYVNLTADIVRTTNDKISDLSKIKFFSSIDFNKDKYVNVPIEEDQYIAIFISPLNDRMNIRAPWGMGVVIDSFALKNNDDVTYNNYYNQYVSNIGDILHELTSISTNGITKYTKEEFDTFTKYKPQFSSKDLTVYQINTHLNNSPTIQKIRNLYSQKIKYNADLEEVQKSIDNINSTLSSISFDDTSNIRSVYENQLVEYNKKRNEIVAALNSITNEIAMAANDSDVPIESAKYHIRGFYNIPNDFAYANHINGIKVWYRYRNKDQETGNAHSIGNNIYSDWNEMKINRRMRIPSNDGSSYKYEYARDNYDVNEPSYNQIDIPISQGEIVDIKLQVLWDFGYPYIETTSDWSSVVNITFPEELKKHVQVFDIVAENNNDIETNRFNNILRTEGIITHIEDKLIDQDMTYYHQPEHIASGFYTAERRVIPLKDQLLNMNNDIVSLRDEVFGYSANNLKIEVCADDINTVVSQNQTNTVYIIDGVDIMNLQITNISPNHTMKLYPLLVGSRDEDIKDDNYSGFMIQHSEGNLSQKYNQYLYFRSKDAWNSNNSLILGNQLIFPFVQDKYQLCLNSDSKFDYIEIKPEESVVVSLDVSKLSDKSAGQNSSTIQFTIKTSLYTEPTTYEVKFTNDTNNSIYSKIKKTRAIKRIKYSSIVK